MKSTLHSVPSTQETVQPKHLILGADRILAGDKTPRVEFPFPDLSDVSKLTCTARPPLS